MSIIIEKAGILTTVQDEGRTGLQHLGINPNGPMDRLSFQTANSLVGNDAEMPALEIHFPAPVIHFTQSALVGIAGADFEASIDGRAIPLQRTFAVPAGSHLQFHAQVRGQRLYLAVKGGFKLPQMMGSSATNLRAGFGGFHGRSLQRGDELLFNSTFNWTGSCKVFPWYAPPLPDTLTIPARIGPQCEWLKESSQTALWIRPLVLLPQSDRMALRWQGPNLEQEQRNQMISSPVTKGTVQLLPNGQLLTLMADHQTVGGYPRVLQIIKADLPILAQKRPGESIYLKFTTREDAIEALKSRYQQIKSLRSAISLYMPGW